MDYSPILFAGLPTAPGRAGILEFEKALKALVDEEPQHQLELEVVHHFSPGMYGRELRIPADTCLTGKIHKYAHLNVVAKGDITVVTEEGTKRVCAPAIFVSPPGVKRIGYTHEDTVWITFHVTSEVDLAKIEALVIAKDFEEFELTKDQEAKCLGQP